MRSARPQGLLAFGFGSGLARYAPGNHGHNRSHSPLQSCLNPCLRSFTGRCFLCCFCWGFTSVESRPPGWGGTTPGGIVWDEMVAYWLTVAFLPRPVDLVAGRVCAVSIIRYLKTLAHPPVREVLQGRPGHHGRRHHRRPLRHGHPRASVNITRRRRRCESS